MSHMSNEPSVFLLVFAYTLQFGIADTFLKKNIEDENEKWNYQAHSQAFEAMHMVQ